MRTSLINFDKFTIHNKRTEPQHVCSKPVQLFLMLLSPSPTVQLFYDNITFWILDTQVCEPQPKDEYVCKRTEAIGLWCQMDVMSVQPTDAPCSTYPYLLYRVPSHCVLYFYNKLVLRPP